MSNEEHAVEKSKGTKRKKRSMAGRGACMCGQHKTRFGVNIVFPNGLGRPARTSINFIVANTAGKQAEIARLVSNLDS